MRTTLLTSIAISFTAIAPAQDRVLPHRPVAPTPAPVSIVDLDVDLSVEGPAMRVTQRITLSNPAPRPQEFDLIFPLGTGAVISGVELRDGDVVLEGGVYSADEARRIYREITRRRRDPALVEHYGEALFRARVFPVPANGTQTVTLSYTRVVQPEGDLMRLHLPLTAFRSVARGAKLSVRGELLTPHPVATLYSPTHELDRGTIEEVPTDPKHYRTRFTVEEKDAKCALDFLAYFKARPDGGLLDVTILSERPNPAEDGYFLAVVNGVPTKDVKPDPKDVVFVIDTSGSMEGKKIEQARAALKFLVERLRPTDRFNLVVYSDGASVYSTELLEPTTAAITAAGLFIDRLQAEGSTNIEQALQLALGQLKSDSERLSQVVFLTDGLPTVGEKDGRRLVEHAKKHNAADARIVAFGVGFDVNGQFLDRLAVHNKGLSEYVLPSENIEEKVPGFYSRMQSPLVLDATLAVEGVPVYDVFPRVTGDIYGGHQQLIVGRYRESGPATLKVTGRRGGEPFAQAFTARFAKDAATSGSHDLIARLWASKKVGFLIDEIRLNGVEPELVQAIVRLGTRFGIITEYTSFLAAPETDLAAVNDNFAAATRALGRAAEDESGADAVSQAADSKKRQRMRKLSSKTAYFERGKEVVVQTVVTTGGKTFFRKGEVWQDSAAKSLEADRVVELFSDEFFALLDQNPWLRSCLARTGDAVVKVGEETIRFAAVK